ncbi:Putative oxidoreductase SadH [Frondihabitans sp. 762G35]|uniref:SDR family NAD(P)-dependent oxidoreductase n=1 Tax=Frondihabitans sp. 762G35 TaxID=1446794 RepID=UPI000D20F9D2|nr:SDR family oxidoreductase [Frondihabitans sp. 762G35]ARC58644.1 Putative oxidoreductase SadH [Frondihabitans sp. 762G35]
MRLADSVIVVTGGGNGIGRQVALHLLRLGARVAIVDLNSDGLEETKRLAGAPAKNQISTHALNVTDRDAVDALPVEVIARHGQVDGVINVAGIIHRFVRVDELSMNELHRIVDVNFWGTVNISLAFLPHLRQRPEASLVNISSLSALLPFAGQTFYGATKAAIKLFSEGLYQELRDTGVRVTTVFPGNISTNISGNSGVTALEVGDRKVRATTPEETARKIVAGMQSGRFRVLVGTDAIFLDALSRVSPRATTNFIARQMQGVLPRRLVTALRPKS